MTRSIQLTLAGVLAWQALGHTSQAPGQIATPQPGQVVTPRTPAQPTPPRDPLQVRKGTAVLRGQVVDAATGNPVRRARVTASSIGSPAPGAMTDVDGAFEIAELSPGKYLLEVEKTGYL